MTTAATPTITDTRFNKLMEKLRKLFELDKSDLDFGIYRIMAAKNKEVTDFLDRQLKDVVRQTLASHGANAVDSLDEHIAAARKAASDAGFNPDDSPKVQELEAARAKAGGASAEELEADIYNHLLAFFGRYYDEGDFISQRRYKGDTYAIPYSGEEVTLHWANKDQYYIKSGEWHKDYRFKLPDGRRVRFALVDATQETGNNKEPDEAKRRYILVDDQPVVAEGDTLTFHFHFKAPSEAEKERAADGAVAIFGGDYAKDKSPKKGDERTQFCADAEQRAIEHIPAEWKDAVTAAASTPDKPDRTLLGKHLNAFTARNTFDYFIHKDLGGFLRRELDFYIKNEVVRLDDLDAAPAEHLQRVQGRVRAIRRVASKVIELLESLENFQKKLWLKKKFVLNTSWLVTVDRVPERLRDVVAGNAGQWDEWERLGFKPEGDAGGLFGGAEWGTRAYLDACDKLVVDTRLFDEAFTAELLASDEVLAGAASLDVATCGASINGDNAQALGVIEAVFKGRINSAYIDPPYNTERDRASGVFLYKDGYPASSWIALLHDRLTTLHKLLQSEATTFVSIDDNELTRLNEIMRRIWGEHDFVDVFSWLKTTTPAGLSKKSKKTVEYVLAYEKAKGPRRYVGVAKEARSANTLLNQSNQIGDLEFPAGTEVGFEDCTLQPGMYGTQKYDVELLSPLVAKNGVLAKPSTMRARFRWTQKYFDEQVLSGVKVRIATKALSPSYEKEDYGPETPPNLIDKKVGVGTNENASDAFSHLMGDVEFPYPKPVSLVEYLFRFNTASDGCVLDCFAGSGTTGDAILSMNRADQGNRTFVLVEMGGYFLEVLVPRIAKTIYSPDWKDGEAQTHDQGVSALVKCFAVESYEDALNNLPAPTGGMFDRRPAEEADALIRYALDLEMGPHLLDLDIFRDPWGHAINAQLAGDDEIKRHRVDLVETFNYLLGLRVSAYGPIERYSAEFERAEHDDGLGRLKIVPQPGIRGGLRKDPEGAFKFQSVQGTLNDGKDTRVLVVWRTLTDDPEKDAAVLDAWMEREQVNTGERSPHRDFTLIYVNGCVTRPQPTQGLREIYPIEETFKRKMFEDTDGVS